MLTMKLLFLRFKTVLLFCCLFFNAEFGIAQHSVAHDWNEILLEAIRNDFARPTVHAEESIISTPSLHMTWMGGI